MGTEATKGDGVSSGALGSSAAAGASPKLTTIAELTSFIMVSSRCPIFSLSLRLSSVRICSNKITLSFAKPYAEKHTAFLYELQILLFWGRHREKNMLYYLLQ